MIRIALQVDDRARSRYAEALERLRGVEAAGDAPADASITDTAEASAKSSLPCLLHNPHRGRLEDLETLAGRRVMPAHPWRFRPDLVPVQRSLASGQFGEAALLRIHDWRTSHGSPIPDAVPAIDLALWLFAARPDSAFGIVRPDYLQAHLGFPGGGMALIDVVQGLGDDYRSLHLIGSRGAAYLDDHHDREMFCSLTGSAAAERDGMLDLAVKGLLEEFVAGVREERAWSVSIDDTIAAVATAKEVRHG